MNLKLSTILQILTVLLGILDQILPVVPAKYKQYVLIGTGIITVILHTISGNSNPDGTSSATHNSTIHQ